MNAWREKDQILLTLEPTEGHVLRHVLIEIDQHYQLDPSALDPEAQSAWYSTRGCQSAGMSDEDTQEWIGQLHHTRSDRCNLIQSWIKDLNPSVETDSSCTLSFNFTEATHFITVINDQRLLLAARHHIGQTEMDGDLRHSITSLKPNQLAALCEIQLLAYLVESILQFLSD